MTHWLDCPHARDYAFDAADVRAHWQQLHVLDAEPLPRDDAVLRAWALFHAGQLQAAEAAGLAAGADGMSVALRAAALYATLIEPHEPARLERFRALHARASAFAAEAPDCAAAWYWQGFALGRHAQGIHIARALAQGVGTQVRAALGATLRLAPTHAFAHITLASFHAEVIDKVGPLVAAMTYGATSELAHVHLREALRLAPDAASVLVNGAQVLTLLEGEARLDEAVQMQQRAADLTARDAAERLWVELARAQLAL